MQQLRSRMRDTEGATAVEYGIMVALIAIVIIAAVWFVGQTLQKTFDEVGECIDKQAVEQCPGADGDGGDTDGTD